MKWLPRCEVEQHRESQTGPATRAKQNFRVNFRLYFKAKCEVFDGYEDPFSKFRTSTRFERENEGNSKMVYYKKDFQDIETFNFPNNKMQ